MVQIKSVICPHSLAPESTAAIRHAMAVANWYEAELHALLVVPPPIAPGGVLPLGNEVELDLPARTALLAELDAAMMLARESGLKVRVSVEEGEVAGAIVRVAAAEPFGLIVMATHGRTGLEKFVLGSVTEKVLRTAPCPVLTIPPASREPSAESGPVYRRILCAVDFSKESLNALGYALSLAQEAGGKVTLLNVVEWFDDAGVQAHRRLNLASYRANFEAESRSQLRKLVPPESRDWCEAEEVVGFGKAYAQIVRKAGEMSADLIVLGVRGRGSVDLKVFGSTANRVVREAGCPVLTVRAG